MIQALLYGALIAYIAGTILYFAGNRIQNTWALKTSFGLAITGGILNILVLIYRGWLTGRLPLSNGYEFIMTFTCITALMYVIYEIKSGNARAGGTVMLITSLLILSVVGLMRDELGSSNPLMPALKSPWLTFHVLTAAVAYSGFALAAGLAIIQLRSIELTADESTDESIYRIVAISFTSLSLSIVLGGAWAEQAWGSYWSWDPKETWALITWIVYAVYLHLHRQSGWKGKPAKIMVIAGFVIVLFTFFGVNYFMSGLHSYA
jgi:ABC-type transport system involved in cytochrome c biogenesis, permease component